MEISQRTVNSKTQAGFTLTGLLVCTGILAVLLAVAQPPLSELNRKIKIRRAVRDYVSALETARTTAITEHIHVTVCRSNNDESCSGEWHQGAIVFTDADRDRSVDDEDSVILVISPHPAARIVLKAFGNRQFLQFTPRGVLRYQSGNMTFCPSDNNTLIARQLIINTIGRIRQARDTNRDGIVEDAQGEAVSCEQ